MRHRIAIHSRGMDACLKKAMRSCVRLALLREPCPYPCRVDIHFAGDFRSMRTVNRQTRGVDFPTDVLSFPAVRWHEKEKPRPDEEDGRVYLGEILICTPVAALHAAEYGHSYKRELAFLATHGVLHLLGYDHEEEEERRVMRKQEEAILSERLLPR